MEKILDFVKPELLVLIPVLYFIGMGLKKAAAFTDKWIPLMLGLIGVVLAAVYVVATSEIAGYQAWLLAVFTGLTQGVLCAGCSVYVNQIFKQAQKAE